jgi:hypothetical protein
MSGSQHYEAGKGGVRVQKTFMSGATAMNSPKPIVLLGSVGILTLLCIAFSGCGDDGAGPEEKTGATLEGRILTMGAPGPLADLSSPSESKDPILQIYAEPVNNVTVSIGKKSTKTDGSGSFVLRDIPLGNQVVGFSGSGITASYNLNGVAQGTVFSLNGIQISVNSVRTEHTGTWVGTAGSSESSSQGQVAFTLIISANGNALTGTGSVVPPDNSIWTMSGIETGKKVEGIMTLVSSNSSCATGGTLTGTFSADTLSGTFLEVNPPAGCGAPESGTFRVVKQQGSWP